MMSTCRWCTPVTLGVNELLQKYCSGLLTADDERAVNEDLCFCLECVVEYHRAKAELPQPPARLQELEVSRLLACFTQACAEELEDDDLFIVEEDQEILVPKITGAEFENLLRVPITEMLKYPYLLENRQLTEMFVEALCKMEKLNPFKVFEKFPGIYLLLVYPNEQVRRWAIRAAKSLGKVDRDDFYELKETFSLMFHVLDLDLFQNSDIYISCTSENEKSVLLSPHLYDAKNYKDYWLGICMLLTQLDGQAMDSLVLAPTKQTEIIKCILTTMEKTVEDETMDPFWPALQCFMVILHCLGSRIWGQLIEPTAAFQAITGSPSYTAEINKIRRKSLMPRVKVEMENDDDMTCSQMIYDCNETKKVTSTRKSACGESNSLIFEEMHWLVNVLQHDLGLDMRVHHSTFLWFIPFVKSVMDLNELSIVYIEEVINYLCGEIKDLINGRVQTCDEVTEVFIFILVHVIEFHLSRSRMNVLYYPSPKWVEVIVKCATLPSTAFSLISDSGSHSLSSASLSCNSPVTIAVPQACMQTIRCLLREGGKLTSHSKVMHFLDLLNKQIREAPQKQWKLTDGEAIELQGCLKQLVKVMKEKHSAPLTDCIESMYPEMSPVDSSDSHKFTEDCKQAVKREPVWDNERYGRMDANDDVNVKAVQEDGIVAKKEALVPEHHHAATGTKLKELLQSSKLLDPNKLQAIKSKLGQSFPKLKVIATKFNFKDLEGMSSEHQPGLNRTAEEHPNIAGNEEHLERSESVISDYTAPSDNLPLSVVKSHLKKTQKIKHLSTVSIHKPDRDRSEKDVSANEGDIHALESSTEVSKPLRRVKQKVNKTLENAENDVIVISDSESTENSDISLCSNKGTGNESGKANNLKVKTESPDADAESSPGDIYGGDLNECDSQLFEFESQDHVHSEWSDCPVYTSASAQETKKEKPVSKAPPSPGVMASSSTCEYDTDPVSDESIENTVSLLEDRLKKQKTSSKPKASIGTDTVFRSAKDLPVKCTGKRFPSIKKRMQPHKKEREPKGAVTAAGSSSAATGMPAIVPPKKVRKPVESVSTAEKLGLKKKERIAPDLSQRSSECVGKLRKHGQEFRVEPGLRMRRTRRSNMIRPQRMNARRPKKLLASQDMQYFRQSRAKRSSLPGSGATDRTTEQTRAACNKGDHIVASKDDELRHTSLIGSVAGIKGGERKVGQRQEERTRKLSGSELNLTENNKPSSSVTQYNSNCIQKPDFSRSSIEHNEGVDHVTGSTFEDKPFGVDIASDDRDLDDVCLTQNQPLDMELCSQMEEGTFYTQRDPIDMDIEPESQMNTAPSFHSDQQGDKLVLEGTAQVEPVVPKILPGQMDNNDHVFLKPGMSPSSLKKAKPSTTKIYAPSSRSATLAEEMKTTKLPQVAMKNKLVRPLPAPRTNIPPSEFKRPPPPRRHVSFKPLPTPSSATGALSHAPTYKTYQRPEAPVLGTMSYSEAGPRLDQAILIGDVLKWTFDMFTNYNSFGIPSDLRRLKEVSPSYRYYEEYYGTFYPLLLNNTFEELVSEWMKKVKSGTIVSHNLKFTGIEYNNRIASATFKAFLSDHDVKQQQYPKEDDFVILWLPPDRRAYSDEELHLTEEVAHFGCVSRYNLLPGGKVADLTLTVQTYGNVASVNNQPVRCELIGSLVTATRQFKALCLLKSSSMKKPLLAPHVEYFRAQPDRIPNLSLPGCNPEQIKAICSGISIVKRPEKTPKICLIHGPPGTGKSLTIVRLLQKLFSEGLTNASHVGPKTRKLRVLLCAPSNAAIDSLMKKVIVGFKESCRDIHSPLGNCGDINLVRVGNDKSISKSLMLFSLDSQTRNRIQKAQHSADVDIQRWKEQLDQRIDSLSKRLAMETKNRAMFDQLMDQKGKLLKEREQLSRNLREARIRKLETQTKVLQDAHIICCTLSTSGRTILESAFRRLGHEPFGCVIVDEAGQATELETLIPMVYRCPALILVGDPEQLPPTVVSQTAKEKKYDQSLMARLWRCLHHIVRENPRISSPIIFLNWQYRMHPDICEFPSKYIYNKALKTDGETAQKRCAVSWPFQPYRLFDVKDGSEIKENGSFCNAKEVKLVLILIKLIMEKQVGRLGVITPYSAQKVRIKDLLEREMAKEDSRYLQVEVDTVDGFQGREMECIIVSCVRASSEHGSIGFLDNRQRLNVTITRAKCSFFVLGHLRTLKEHKDWGALIDDAGKRGTIIQTCEKNFEKDAMQIFKPDSGMTRTPRLPLQCRVGRVEQAGPRVHVENSQKPPTASGDRPARIVTHRASDPLLATCRGPTSPTPGRPQDPRLARLIEAPPPQPERGVLASRRRVELSRSSSYSGQSSSHREAPGRRYRDPNHGYQSMGTSGRVSRPAQGTATPRDLKRASETQCTSAPFAKKGRR
ncbi:probable helicase senataxin isoform X2 [Brienomyrus brachyistius]|uniref:probable helicase senataxin isoform X1 n=1 Tax=Brienomyrus brachyistius TaxID=42636 RepID=UPI0020B44D58|nr:probable helicase senataxin isoform X1 [Brienomyrus brachyistius]XP_048877355.1 probable helicase senataxin isoform X2 [Brienomyrus brachyistius]